MARRTPIRTNVFVAAALALVLGAGAARAQTSREQAIALADEGSRRLDKKDFAGAIDKFDAAFALVPVPVFALQSATALEMSGRLIDALARYRSVFETKADPTWSSIQREAQVTARERHERLSARIPRIVVTLSGARPERVELDGKDATADALAAGVAVDPGQHRVTARAGPKLAEKTVVAAEGRTERIELVLAAEDRAVSEAAPAVAPAPSPETATPIEERPTSSAARTVGWVALGVGAAGVVVGGVGGVLALGKKGDLEGRCPDRHCPPSAWDDNDSYDRWRTLSTVGFVVGGIGIATGGVLLWTAPASARSAARLRLRGGPGRLTLDGEF